MRPRPILPCRPPPPLLPGAHAQAEQLRSSFRRRDGSYAAYQCPACRYGPVAHLACADLESHHGEGVGTTAVNNRCPGCGWFSAQIADWLPWDGTLPS